MPRQPRIFIDGAMYHVYNRLSRGGRDFKHRDQAHAFVTEMIRVKARDRLIVYAWCLLPTHYHLLVRTSDRPLWRSMATIGLVMTRQINRKARVKGPGWQSRYKAKMVEDQQYFDRLVAYVHLNPVAAGVVSDPGLWRWCGHWEIVHDCQPALIDADETLGGFGEDRGTAGRHYVAALRAGHAEPWLGEGPGRLPWWSYGRSPAGPLRIRSDVVHVQSGRSTGPERPAITASDATAAVCGVTGLASSRITGSGKDRYVTLARRALALVACDRYTLSVKSVADFLRKRPDLVSCWLRSAADRRSSQSLAELADRVDERLRAQHAGIPRET